MSLEFCPDMKNNNKNWVTLLLAAIFLVFSYQSVKSYSADEYSMTPAQKHFTSILQSLPGITSVTWESPVSLWIKVSSRAVGSPPDPKKAYDLARTLSDRGMTALRQPLCVHIYQNKSTELAKSCVYF